jgi:hypothetical protein
MKLKNLKYTLANRILRLQLIIYEKQLSTCINTTKSHDPETYIPKFNTKHNNVAKVIKYLKKICNDMARLCP